MNKMSNDLISAKDKLIEMFKDYHWFYCVSFKESNNGHILSLEVSSFNDNFNGIHNIILQKFPELKIDGFKFEVVINPKGEDDKINSSKT
jgi:hypothetical protein